MSPQPNPPGIGDRVGLIVDIEADVYEFLGYGVYEGDFVPGKRPKNELADEIRKNKILCPRFKLDSGEVVWGCETSWGHETVIRHLLDGAREYCKIKVAKLRRRPQ